MNFVHVLIALGAIVTTLGTSVLTGLFGSSKRAQAATALVLSAMLGVAAAAQQGALDNLGWHSFDKIAYAAGVVYAASQVAFHGIWKPVNGATWLETLVGPKTAAIIDRDLTLAKLIGSEVAAALAAQHATAAPSLNTDAIAAVAPVSTQAATVAAPASTST